MKSDAQKLRDERRRQRERERADEIAKKLQPDNSPLKELRELSALMQATFRTEEGRMILEWIQESCRYRETLFSTDTQTNAYNQGRQSVINDIMIILEERYER